MRNSREELAALLRPLVERMWRGHCWIKTRNGPRRLSKPFTETELSEHIAQSNAYGLCPIAPGESTCRVAVLDLDSHKGQTPWETMLNVANLIAIALELDGYQPILFRSSGGKGIHIYLMWDTPQDAYSVRQMLIKVLQSCELKSGTSGIANKTVEIFPKQDSVPPDGCGSMVVLPFAGASELLG